ncbi:MAG: uL15 family ribosomal protein [Thermofilaceae archaeon]
MKQYINAHTARGYWGFGVVVRREKKSKYYRGSRTHGWGRVGQHRRSGRKGGRGRAGFHKHKWTWVMVYAKEMFGKHGFSRPLSILPNWKIINVGELDEMAEELVKHGLAKIEEGKIYVDVSTLGYNKVGGRGKVTKPLVIFALKATENAVRKLEEAGGSFINLKGG